MTEDAPRLLWLNGAPGAGKSSIATSVARHFVKNGLLWAQFFISRNHKSTTNPKSIFPSIARQLVNHSPYSAAACAIHDALKADCTILDFLSDSQVAELFVKPIKAEHVSHPSVPIVVVIDAMDECESQLRELARILAGTVKELPCNAKLFISSRIEEDIRVHFSFLPDTKHSNSAMHISLDNSAAINDVAKFFTKQIGKIVEERGEEWSNWPGEARMKELCDKASGLFIWAVTATNFIRTRIEDDGLECRDDVLDELNSEGMETVDDLYDHILRRISSDKRGNWAAGRFRNIVGAIVCLREPLPLSALKDLLDLRKPMGKRSPVDVQNFVRKFRTVLVTGTEDVTDETIPRLHKSFIEFITGERAGALRVHRGSTDEDLAIKCLRQVNGLRRNQCGIEHWAAFNKDIPDLKANIDLHLTAQLRYACRFWAHHLPKQEIGAVDVELRDTARLSTLTQLLREFFCKHLLHWIEAMSLLESSAVPPLLKKAKEWGDVRIFPCFTVLYSPTLVDRMSR